MPERLEPCFTTLTTGGAIENTMPHGLWTVWWEIPP
jgi:hypothetical protein